MDEYSSSVFELFNEGKSKEEILEKINNKPTKYEIN
jgi:hypothetical protein